MRLRKMETKSSHSSRSEMVQIKRETTDWFHHVHTIVAQIDSAVSQMASTKSVVPSRNNFYQQQYQRYMVQHAKSPSGAKKRRNSTGIAVGELMTFSPVEYR